MAKHYAFAALFIASSVQAQYWIPRADHPDTVYVTHGFVLNDRIFVGGGVSAFWPTTEYTGFHEYIPATDTWEARTPLQPTRYGVGGFSIAGKGYVACGWHNNTQLNDLWQYDTSTDSWTEKANFPGAGRYSCISIGTSTKGYLGLGYSPWANDWWEYDPENDTWTQKASFPMIGRQAANAFVINDQVYVGLGARDVGNSTATLYNDWYRYDPQTDTWTAIAPLPAPPRIAAYVFSINNVGYVMGGAGLENGTKMIYNDMWAYNVANDQWMMMGLFPSTPMNAGVALPTSNTVFLGTGGIGLGPNNWVPTLLTNAWWEYRPGGIEGITEGSTGGEEVFVLQQDDELVIGRQDASVLADVELLDAMGRSVSERVQMSMGSNVTRMNVSGLATGVYLVRITNGGQVAAVRTYIE